MYRVRRTASPAERAWPTVTKDIKATSAAFPGSQVNSARTGRGQSCAVSLHSSNPGETSFAMLWRGTRRRRSTRAWQSKEVSHGALMNSGPSHVCSTKSQPQGSDHDEERVIAVGNVSPPRRYQPIDSRYGGRSTEPRGPDARWRGRVQGGLLRRRQ